MDLILDINSWLYPMELGESFIIDKLIAFVYWSDQKWYLIFGHTHTIVPIVVMR